jgi:CheY-like chemotaxis protein/HPt (histidine-containing phosphotransfer) domain-containing protein
LLASFFFYVSFQTLTEKIGASGMLYPTLRKGKLISALKAAIDDFEGKKLKIATPADGVFQDSSRQIEQPDQHGEAHHESDFANIAGFAKLAGLNILLVEDDPINQQVTTELLEDAQVHVYVASNGLEALKQLNIKPDVDMVLMDLQMPVMNGYESTRKIREDRRFATLPIIAMTARAMTEEKQRCFNSGMNDHIIKPLEVSKFYQTILRWTKDKEQADNRDNPSIQTTVNYVKISTRQEHAAEEQQNKPAAGKVITERTEMTQTPLPELPGFEIEEALKRLNGSVKLYTRLLGRFLESYGNGLGRNSYNAALADADPEAGMRFAHTIKGLAASLGANKLSEAAKALEFAYKDNAVTPEIAENCLSSLDQVCSTLATGLGQSASGSAPAAAPAPAQGISPATKALVDKITALLADDDAEAGNVFNDNRAAISSVLSAAQLDEVRKALDNYDFSAALNIFKQLKP